MVSQYGLYISKPNEKAWKLAWSHYSWIFVLQAQTQQMDARYRGLTVGAKSGRSARTAPWWSAGLLRDHNQLPSWSTPTVPWRIVKHWMIISGVLKPVLMPPKWSVYYYISLRMDDLGVPILWEIAIYWCISYQLLWLSIITFITNMMSSYYQDLHQSLLIIVFTIIHPLNRHQPLLTNTIQSSYATIHPWLAMISSWLNHHQPLLLFTRIHHQSIILLMVGSWAVNAGFMVG